MKRLLYFIVVVFFISSCEDDHNESSPAPLKFFIEPHNSNGEFYAGAPVEFGLKVNGPFYGYSLFEIYVDGVKVKTTYSLQHLFTSPGSYRVQSLVILENNRKVETDTVINVVNGPPVFGDPKRGEKVLFGWKVGSDYQVLLGTYFGSSALDYELLSIDESMQQQGALKKLTFFSSYPEMHDLGTYDFSSSGKLAFLYDNTLDIYDESFSRSHRIFFNHGNIPERVLVKGGNVILLSDSLSYVTLRSVDMTTGKISKGATKYIGVDDMTAYGHFFLDQSRIASYFVEPNNSKTLLMGSYVGGNVEFSQYFLPPVFINRLIPLSSGGYVLSGFHEDEYSSGKTLTIHMADQTNVVKWSRPLRLRFLNYEYLTDRVAIKELGGFIYVFFDNMRCIKFSMAGDLVWDKYFYSSIARFEDVVITPGGEFMMLGTRSFSENDNLDYALRKDAICIKINTDGVRIVQ